MVERGKRNDRVCLRNDCRMGLSCFVDIYGSPYFKKGK